MANSSGWVKIDRRIWNNPVLAGSPYNMMIWVWLITHATYRPYNITVNGEIITLKPGQLRASRRTIAVECGVSESRVQRTLKLFESEQMIEQVTKSKTRLITVVSWHKYQSSEPISELQLNSNRTPTELQLNPNKNNKNKRNKELLFTDEDDDNEDILSYLNRNRGRFGLDNDN